MWAGNLLLEAGDELRAVDLLGVVVFVGIGLL